MDFTLDEYVKFNQYDFFYCCLISMRKAYELEPTNYEQRFILACVYHQEALMTRYDGKNQKSDEYFKKAMLYCQEAQSASPSHPVINKYIKALRREMERER